MLNSVLHLYTVSTPLSVSSRIKRSLSSGRQHTVCCVVCMSDDSIIHDCNTALWRHYFALVFNFLFSCILTGLWLQYLPTTWLVREFPKSLILSGTLSLISVNILGKARIPRRPHRHRLARHAYILTSERVGVGVGVVECGLIYLNRAVFTGIAHH